MVWRIERCLKHDRRIWSVVKVGLYEEGAGFLSAFLRGACGEVVYLPHPVAEPLCKCSGFFCHLHYFYSESITLAEFSARRLAQSSLMICPRCAEDERRSWSYYPRCAFLVFAGDCQRRNNLNLIFTNMYLDINNDFTCVLHISRASVYFFSII